MSRDVMQQALRLIEDEGHKADLLEAASILRAALAEQSSDSPAPVGLPAGEQTGPVAGESTRAEQAQPTSEAGWLHRLDMEKSAAWMAGYAQGLKRAAEQAQPVAWGAVVESGGSLICASSTGHSGTPIPVGTLIYTAPPAPQPLTELPPMPEPAGTLVPPAMDEGKQYAHGYTAEQMRAYARAVEAEMLKRMGVQR